MKHHERAHATLRFDRRDLLAPLVIGATGHRDLDPAAAPDLTAKVHEIFLELRSNLPYTPIVLMSGLAEGADRLIAHAALAAEIGAELIAVLPMDREVYLADFATGESRAEFADLLSRARETITLADGGSGELEASAPGTTSTSAYERLGRFLATRCHALIALWDGERGQPGGTAEVVDWMLIRGATMASGAAVAKTFNVAGPVYQVVTPRRRYTARRGVERLDLFPQGDELDLEPPAASCARHIFAPLERFNREVCALSGVSDRGEIAASERELVPDVALMDPEIAPIREGLTLIRRRYGIANAIAQRNRDRIHRALWGLIALVFVAALLVDLSMHLFGAMDWPHAEALAMFGYPALMVAAFMLWWRAQRHQFQDRYQDFRALAEGLRVQFFWRLAGVDDTVSDHYVGRHRWELDWIRDLCRDALVAGWPLGKLTSNTAAAVRRYWVQAQLDYFDNAIRRERRTLRCLEITNWLLLAAGFALAAAVGAGALIALHYTRAAWKPLLIGETGAHGLLLVTITMTAVAAALSHFRIGKLALHAHLRMYRRMKILYASALERMTDVDNPRFASTLEWLGAQALLENGEWVVTHRDRPLEVPHH